MKKIVNLFTLALFGAFVFSTAYAVEPGNHRIIEIMDLIAESESADWSNGLNQSVQFGDGLGSERVAREKKVPTYLLEEHAVNDISDILWEIGNSWEDPKVPVLYVDKIYDIELSQSALFESIRNTSTGESAKLIVMEREYTQRDWIIDDDDIDSHAKHLLHELGHLVRLNHTNPNQNIMGGAHNYSLSTNIEEIDSGNEYTFPMSSTRNQIDAFKNWNGWSP